MRDPLAVELKLYEIGMRNGLRGRSLERYVSDMHREFRVPRVPEPPPAPARQTVEPREVRGQAPRPQGRGRQLPLFP